jgi:hypothetical protein
MCVCYYETFTLPSMLRSSNLSMCCKKFISELIFQWYDCRACLCGASVRRTACQAVGSAVCVYVVNPDIGPAQYKIAHIPARSRMYTAARVRARACVCIINTSFHTACMRVWPLFVNRAVCAHACRLHYLHAAVFTRMLSEGSLDTCAAHLLVGAYCTRCSSLFSLQYDYPCVSHSLTRSRRLTPVASRCGAIWVQYAYMVHGSIGTECAPQIVNKTISSCSCSGARGRACAERSHIMFACARGAYQLRPACSIPEAIWCVIESVSVFAPPAAMINTISVDAQYTFSDV